MLSSPGQPVRSFSDIDKMLATREPLFVKNTTANPACILVVNYPSPEGGRAFHVPRTNIPFNICDYVDPESLRASDSFRKMLLAGHIELVDENRARQDLADPERVRAFRASYDEANSTYRSRAGEAEKARRANSTLREEQAKTQGQGMKNIIAAMNPTLAKEMNIVGADGNRHEPRLIDNVPNPRLNALEARVKGGALDETTIVQELSLMLGDLTIQNLAAIAAGPQWPRVAQDWARERVAFATKSAAAMRE